MASKKGDDKKIKTEVTAEIKRQNRRSLLSPTSIIFVVWVVLVVLLPYVLGWFDMADSFYASIEFEGMVSLVTIAVVVIDLIGDAVKK